MPFKTYVPKQKDVKNNWLLYNAEGLVLGRLAAEVSYKLIGKHKAICTRHLDVGDRVVVINVSKIHLTGNKLNDKVYYRHTGYPGGIKSTTAREVLNGKDPCQLLYLAVKRMLGRGPMARKRLLNLKMYAGNEHPHTGQCPVLCDFASVKRQNSIDK